MEGKTSKQLERHFKGAANHYRIAIIELLARQPGLALEDIVGRLRGTTKNLSAHTVRLVNAGLVQKRYRGRNVVHSLSPYGRRFAAFIKSFKQ